MLEGLLYLVFLLLLLLLLLVLFLILLFIFLFLLCASRLPARQAKVALAGYRPHPMGGSCPRQEPLERNRPPAFTLCYKVSGPSALPPRFEPVDPREEMKMIENRQNKASFSGVCHC